MEYYIQDSIPTPEESALITSSLVTENTENTNGNATQQRDLIDNLTFYLILLFIMSVMTEKFVELIRKYPLQFRWIGVAASIYGLGTMFYNMGNVGTNMTCFLWWVLLILFSGILFASIISLSKHYFNLCGNLAPLQAITYKGDGIREVDKVKQVSLLSFFVGVIIATLFRIDLFDLGSNDIVNRQILTLDWNKIISIEKGQFFPKVNEDGGMMRFKFELFMGIIATGFFLSFGSKFFHDLLDYVFQLKELKEKANEPETYKVESIKELDEHLAMAQQQIVRKAIDENYNRLSRLSNFDDLHMGVITVDGVDRPIACLDLLDSNKAGIPDYLEYTLSNGSVRRTPLKIISDVGQIESTSKPGDATTNMNDSDYFGTIGCALKNIEHEYLVYITCNHVLNFDQFTKETQNGNLPVPGDAVLLENRRRTPLGSWFFGYQSNAYDIGLIDPIDSSKVEKSGYNPIPIFVDENIVGREVHFKGATTRSGSGKIMETRLKPRYVRFSNGIFPLENLFCVANSFQPISQKGDSGAVLHDKDNNVVGLIVAANKNYTFAIPLFGFLKATGFNIY